MSGHEGAVWGVAISPNSQFIASASQDGTVKLWQRDGTLVRTLRGDDKGFTRVAFSPDGRMVAAAGSQTVTMWNIDGTLLTTLYGHTGRAMAIAFSPDQRLLASSSEDRTVRVWNLSQRYGSVPKETNTELEGSTSLCSNIPQ